MKFHGVKLINLVMADVHLHYANNAGRGSDNVTVTFVECGSPRPYYTRGYGEYKEYDILDQYRVSGWRGNVNIPSADIKKYGGIKI